ncbi:MAG: hypothetical protein DMF61_15045 [Blastocatellia bacterium AA13]|nr:MAG: hypothetical protein DMF61_15045 [Blastocatellia bacterium AA13]
MKVDLEDLISQKQAAAIRGVTLQGIHSLVKRGKLKTYMVGDKGFLSRKEVESYVPSVGGRPKKKTSKGRRTRKKAG